jgi:serine protease Do
METDSYVEMPKKKSKVGLVILVLFFMICSFAAGAGGVFLFLKYSPDYENTTVTNITKTEKEVTVTDTGIADAVEKIYDSVVIVENFVDGKLYATGSGFIYKQENNVYYLLTNHHVIKGGDTIKVVFTDKTEVEVKVEGSDMYNDVAVLSYETDKELVVADMGDNEKSRLGDTVFAVGAPLDSGVYAWTVTRGILSGKDREVAVALNSYSNNYIMKSMQTDAAINSGNSGGPLCNSNGEVIGLTNMKLVDSGVEGMGFAIPIEDAILYADAIINGEDTSRPQIGIYMTDVSAASRKEFDLDDDATGVIITDIVEGSPAAAAGLRKGDLIIEINGVQVKSSAELRYQLYKYKAGETISIKYIRNDDTNTAKVTLEKNSDT